MSKITTTKDPVYDGQWQTLAIALRDCYQSVLSCETSIENRVLFDNVKELGDASGKIMQELALFQRELDKANSAYQARLMELTDLSVAMTSERANATKELRAARERLERQQWEASNAHQLRFSSEIAVDAARESMIEYAENFLSSLADPSIVKIYNYPRGSTACDLLSSPTKDKPRDLSKRAKKAYFAEYTNKMRSIEGLGKAVDVELAAVQALNCPNKRKQFMQSCIQEIHLIYVLKETLLSKTMENESYFESDISALTRNIDKHQDNLLNLIAAQVTAGEDPSFPGKSICSSYLEAIDQRARDSMSAIESHQRRDQENDSLLKLKSNYALRLQDLEASERRIREQATLLNQKIVKIKSSMNELVNTLGFNLAALQNVKRQLTRSSGDQNPVESRHGSHVPDTQTHPRNRTQETDLEP